MIDVRWLQRVLDLTFKGAAKPSAERLAILLDEPNEVFPYVATNAGGLAQWPLSRAALNSAARRATRPSSARDDAGSSDIARNRARQQLFGWMHPLIVSSDVNWRPDWEERGGHVEDVVRAINRYRRMDPEITAPSAFIGNGFETLSQGAASQPSDMASAEGGANKGLIDLQRLAAQRPFWWRFLSKVKRRDALRKAAEKRGLFDGREYLARYPDVRTAGMDPLQHYLRHGHAEGRNWR